ncbi:MAG TPA: cystathionine beta-lyase [Xanthobacteraceae bacterium]|nr:cystathionine beta-lyase [Xanthobacteraceae bacterium]
MTSKSGGNRDRDRKMSTRLANSGRDPFAHYGYVNTPVYHASTLLFPSAQDYVAHRGRYQYGRRGTPTSEALETALADIEGPQCEAVALLPSGLAAISAALLSVVRAGDHILVTDSAYGPTRKFCDTILPRYGVTTAYYDPTVGADIASLMHPNTVAVFLESPGSLSFEVQDVPAIAAAAHARNAVVLMDNTWASPIHFRALEKGVDLSIQSGTKYIGGHSDVMLGVVASKKMAWMSLKETVFEMGLCVGPDDMFLGLRGLRTMGVRLAQHYAAGMKVARYLEARPEILRVIHPALESHPGHAIWKRDFTGGCGLFSVIFKPAPVAAVYAFLNKLTLFGIGASWGGFESLAIPFDCTPVRSATKWAPGGPAVRFHIGLEDVGDLIADLEEGFAAFAATISECDTPETSDLSGNIVGKIK